MRRALALLVLAPCLVGLAHAEPVRKAEPAASSEILPLPPVPPFNRPAYEAAPLPDSDARAPQELVPQRIELVPRLYRRPETQTGLGYTPGSAFRERDSDRLNKLGPGFNLRVPIN